MISVRVFLKQIDFLHFRLLNYGSYNFFILNQEVLLVHWYAEISSKDI